jgi:hypothetical protein
MENLEQDDQEQLFIPPLNFAMVAPGVYAPPAIQSFICHLLFSFSHE